MSDHSNRRPGNSVNVRDQVIALMKEGIRGTIPQSKLADLRKKLNDDEVIDAIQTSFYEIQRDTRKRAQKFAKFVDDKFRKKNVPLHIVLKEAEKLRRKNNLSDMEYNEFKHQYQQIVTEKNGTRQEDLIPSTTMSLLFGDVHSTDGLSVKDSDYQALQDILQIYARTKSTYSQCFIQSMQYRDFAPEVKEAEYDSTRHEIRCATHPVLAAMFCPKIASFDQHFLYSNIAHIVKCKHAREPILHDADTNLLRSMILDANDIVCTDKSVLGDLRMRANMQNNLWNAVTSLRSGKFFDCVNNDFFNSVDECKIYKNDSPDLPYTGDEIIIMRRLLAAMSYNPILLTTMPVFGANGQANPMNFPVLNNTTAFRSHFLVRIPDVNVKYEGEINLEDSISYVQTYNENGIPVPKKQSIIRNFGGMLIFFVPRRVVAPDDRLARLIDPSPKFTQIPAHVLINERINNFKINFNPVITTGEATYGFRSGIFLETPRQAIIDNDRHQRHKIIIGNGAIVRDISVGGKFDLGADYFLYSPRFLPSVENTVGTSSSIKKVWQPEPEAEDIMAIKGTIFIFEDVSKEGVF